MDLLSIGLVSLIAGGTTYFLLDTGAGISDLAVKLDYDFRIKVFRVQGLSLRIVLDFILKNPTDRQLKISHPLIMLYYTEPDGEENFLAQNNVYDKTYILRPYSDLAITNLDFNITLSDIVNILATSVDNSITELANQKRWLELAKQLSASVDKIRQHIVYKAYFKVNGIEIKYESNLEGLGYSPMSAIERPIKDGREFDKYFALPQGKRRIVIKDGEVDDTVEKMHEIVKSDAHLIKEFSKLFKAPTRYETAQKIYDWIYHYLKYNLEEGEQLKNPLVSYHLGQRLAREFYNKHGYYNPAYSVDCDDISIFVASILYNLGIPYAFRIASYNPARGYQHVYTITWDEAGNEIIIDPVYWQFNAEKPYIKQKTVQALDGIPVEYLYGTDNTEQDSIFLLLQNARNAIASGYFGKIQGKQYLLPMYDYALRYWNSPYREKAITILAEREKSLCEQGLIKGHNLFRQIYTQLGLGDVWDVVLMTNPLTLPFGLARYLYKKVKTRPPSQSVLIKRIQMVKALPLPLHIFSLLLMGCVAIVLSRLCGNR